MSKIEVNQKTVYAIFTCVIILLSAFGVITSQSANIAVTQIGELQTQLDSLTVQVNQPVASVITAMQKEASYIIGVSGSTIWLMNGTGDRAGRVEWTSTNASAIINAALGNVTNGGTILIKAGTYTQTSSININNFAVEICGEGKGTKLEKGFNGNQIEMSGTAKWFQAVRNMYLDGNSATYTGSGIHLEYTYGTTDAKPLLENLWIDDQASNGVFAEGAGTREIIGTNILARICDEYGFMLGGTDGKYVNLVAENCGKDGIQTGGGSNQFVNCKVFGCGNDGSAYYGMNVGGSWQSIIGCYFQDNEYHGLRINGAACTVTGCVIQNNGRTSSTARGLVLASGADGTTVTGNVIIENLGVQDYGIYIDANSENNVIASNFIDGNDVAQIYVGDGDNLITNNVGFATENSGTANNSTATTFSITHGLAGTPTWVGFEFNTTAITGQMWTATSTTITVTVAGTSLPAVMACYWKAEYDP